MLKYISNNVFIVLNGACWSFVNFFLFYFRFNLVFLLYFLLIFNKSLLNPQLNLLQQFWLWHQLLHLERFVRKRINFFIQQHLLCWASIYYCVRGWKKNGIFHQGSHDNAEVLVRYFTKLFIKINYFLFDLGNLFDQGFESFGLFVSE